MTDFYHILSVLVSLIALYYSYKVKKLFGKIYSQSFVFVIAGIVLLMLSHFVELFFSESMADPMEHLLFSAGMLALTLSFVVLLKSLGKFYKG